MRLSSVISDSLSLTLRHPVLWAFGLFVAAGGGASGGANSGGQGQEAQIQTGELPAQLEGLAGGAAQVGEAIAAHMPLVLGGAAVFGLGMLALHVLSEGALIEGVSRLHREPKGRFGLRQGARLGLGHFGAVLKVKLLALGLGLALATLVAAPFALAGLGVLPVAGGLALGIPMALAAVPAGISLYLLYALGMRVAVLENRGALDALRRTRRMLHGRLLDGIKLLLTVGIGRIGAGFLAIPAVFAALLAGGLGWLLGGLSGAVLAVVIVALPLALLAGGLLGAWQSSVWTLGYLATVEEGR